MISFKVSSPGKVILFGEHAVVYGKTALAASLDLRSSLHFLELKSDEFIHLEMPKLNVSKKIVTTLVQETLFHADFPKLNVQGHDEFLQNIRNFVETIGYEDQRQKNSLECFFYALVQVAQEQGINLKSFAVKLDTELSIGAGAGSSASFAVCLVAAFYKWSQLQKDSKALSTFESASLEKISKYALNCEKIMHGAPSGIDNSICTFGSIIEFRKSEEPKFISLNKSLRILLVDTKVGRSTKLLVDKLAGLLATYPDIFQRVIEAIDVVSKQVVGIFEKLKNLKDNENDKLLETYKELSILVDVNQGLLTACQVSHASLDLICLTAKKHGFSAKLTGAGGGGFAYILITPDMSNSQVQKLSTELTESGFTVIETHLGGSGVKVHDYLLSEN